MHKLFFLCAFRIMCAGWAFWGMSWPCNWAFQLRSCGHWSSFLVIAPVGGGIPLRCSIVGLKTLVGNASTQTQLFAPQAWQGGLVVIGTSWARFWPFATVPSCSCAVASLDFLFCKATRPKCRILWKPCMWRYVEQEAPDEHYYEKVSPMFKEPLYPDKIGTQWCERLSLPCFAWWGRLLDYLLFFINSNLLFSSSNFSLTVL